jgi:hypothetical protein
MNTSINIKKRNLNENFNFIFKYLAVVSHYKSISYMFLI